MHTAQLNSSASANHPSIDVHSQLDPDPGLRPDLAQLSEDHNAFAPASDIPDKQLEPTTSNVSPLHDTTNCSPHPIRAEAQLEEAIIGLPAAGTADTTGAAAIAGAPDETTVPANTPGTARKPSTSPKMVFSGLYKSTKLPLSRLRHHSHPVATTAPDYDADLLSRDKIKQKDAIKRFLGARIRSDWVFKWPPPSIEPDAGDSQSHAENRDKLDATPNLTAAKTPEDDLVLEETDDEDDVASTYSTVSEDYVHFRPRAEWISDVPDDDDDERVSPSAYRFDSPDTVGAAVKAAALAKSAKRRRAMRAEMEWNSGLACFNARRNAWTGAKIVRIRPKPTPSSPTSPTTKRLSFWRLSMSTSPSSASESGGGTTPLSPSATQTSGETTALSSSDGESKEAHMKPDSSTFPVETLIPIPPPILPPATPMRASITPASYSTIYDKIVLQSATPSCPVNLSDITRACVVGWKRDGEWPPRGVEPPPVVAVRRKRKDSAAEKPHASRRLSLSFLGRKQSTGGDPGSLTGSTAHPEDTGGPGKGIRKSLQRVLGFGHERSGSNTSNHGCVAG
ncbi:hypothetical protein F4779DRAFT_289158 [Xylariaceae sp. FL0662B]|nr:hypothetical protein F4779DRAFT_289158 [Xylariaceae sp. FL0662B]